MPRAIITTKLVRSCVPPIGSKFTEYFDTRQPGLVLRVAAGGTKSWNAVFRERGRARRVTVGKFPLMTIEQARDAAGQALLRRPRTVTTFASLVAEYSDQHLARCRRGTQALRIIERELLPAWGDLPASAIDPRTVAMKVDDIAARAPVLANRTLAHLKALYNWGIGWGLVELNPSDRIKRPSKEATRDRVLSSDEIRSLWKACNLIDGVVGVYFQFCLATGQRGHEVSDMRWKDIADGMWTVSSATAKNAQGHRVPLSDLAKELLVGLQRNSEFIFSSRDGMPLRTARKQYRRICSTIGLADTRPHDLRRTAGSMMASLGRAVWSLVKFLTTQTVA